MDTNARSFEIKLERYRYILQQINVANENIHRFLALYQTLATAIIGAGIALFVSFREWGIPPEVARSGMIGLTILLSVVASFTGMLIISSVLSWIDYRKEECELSDVLVEPGFRKAPRLANFFRWHETYILAFIAISAIAMWVLVVNYAIPNMH